MEIKVVKTRDDDRWQCYTVTYISDKQASIDVRIKDGHIISFLTNNCTLNQIIQLGQALQDQIKKEFSDGISHQV